MKCFLYILVAVIVGTFGEDVAHNVAIPECGPGMHYDSDTGNCVADSISVAMTIIPECGPGMKYEPATGNCIHAVICPPGFKVRFNTCVPITHQPIVACPYGYIYTSGFCRPVGPPPLCPPGYALMHGSCFPTYNG